MNEERKHIIELIKDKIKNKNAFEILEFISNLKEEKPAFSSSLGMEDQVITHMIAKGKFNIEIFTLDTGRNFPEFYQVLNKTIKKYSIPIKTYFPDTEKVEALVNEKGPFSFYESIENRKECCQIRKVLPLKRALKGKSIWITGIRSEQSDKRKNFEQVEWDEHNQIIKIHPLLHWTWEEVKQYVKENQVPYNILHDKGFVSIGCQPCTRAIAEGEHFRAGRWWWEDTEKKECGLHNR
ncbi:MAG: phosphoadenylyl-sulfate reductase [Bacteroidia bacterium]|nr:phosphoadenylyl-sulfate reductase [Bacteroidia bacterium]